MHRICSHLSSRDSQAGFTLTELIIVMAIFVTLVSIVTLNLVHIQRKTSMDSTINTLITDLNSQQLKAMIGDTEGRVGPDNYGIYLGSGQYTLFHGASYSASDSANFSVTIDSSLHFASPGASVIFTRASGDVLGYSASTNTIVVQDVTNSEQKTIQINKYGAITAIN